MAQSEICELQREPIVVDGDEDHFPVCPKAQTRMQQSLPVEADGLQHDIPVGPILLAPVPQQRCIRFQGRQKESSPRPLAGSERVFEEGDAALELLTQKLHRRVVLQDCSRADGDIVAEALRSEVEGSSCLLHGSQNDVPIVPDRRTTEPQQHSVAVECCEHHPAVVSKALRQELDVRGVLQDGSRGEIPVAAASRNQRLGEKFRTVAESLRKFLEVLGTVGQCGEPHSVVGLKGGRCHSYRFGIACHRLQNQLSVPAAVSGHPLQGHRIAPNGELRKLRVGAELLRRIPQCSPRLLDGGPDDLPILLQRRRGSMLQDFAIARQAGDKEASVHFEGLICQQKKGVIECDRSFHDMPVVVSESCQNSTQPDGIPQDAVSSIK
mmetsp:Transcript_13554/g.29689  ORF Transcript_13554/g.29689 Transcript_13554/m.29689 type:complete len:381 (+) Transcript_13554:1163-2305(+)